MKISKFYTWEIKIKLKVADTWVMDGFDLHDEQDIEFLKDILRERLPYAREDEMKIDIKVTKAPKREAIKKEQGYQNKELLK